LAGLGNCRWAANLARAEARRPRALLVVQPHDVLLEGAPAGMARRVAVDPCGLHPLIANPTASQLLEPVDADSFHREDRLLRLRPPAAVIADMAIGAHNPVAGDEIRNRVIGESGAHRPDRGRAPDLTCDPPIRSNLP